MKRWFILLFLAVPLWAQHSWVTGFPGIENPLSENSAWQNTQSLLTGCTNAGQPCWFNMKTSGGFVTGTQNSSATGFDDSTAILSGAWGANQTVIAVAKNPTSICGAQCSVQEVELRLHVTIGSNFIHGYEADFTKGGLSLVRWDGTGPYTSLCCFTALASNAYVYQGGDVLKASITSAGVITISRALAASPGTFTTLITATDTTYTTGNPGVGVDANSQTVTAGASFTDMGFTSFAATDGNIRAAVTCNSTDVQTQVTAVNNDADVVWVPAGTCTWTSLTYTGTNSMTIAGQSDVIGTCAPGGSCTATDSSVITATAGAISLSIPANKAIRLTGLSLTTTGTASFADMNLNGATSGTSRVRIDHSHISDNVGGGHTFHVDNDTGMADHDLFDGTGNNLFNFQINSPDATHNGQTSWNTSDQFGSGNFFFIENNNFIGPAGSPANQGVWVADCNQGGRFVLRDNVTGFHNKFIQTHGTGSGDQNERGCRAMEIYNNTLTYTTTPATDSFSTADFLEGGTGLAYGNTVGAFCNLIGPAYVRTNPPNSSYTQTNTPGGLGICNGSLVGGVSGPSAWDGNSDATGYPCIDQIARGRGDLISGTLGTNRTNSTTACTPTAPPSACVGWPRQDLVPWYTWNNVINSTGGFCSQKEWGSDPVTAQNRDFFTSIGASCGPGGACTIGVGVGATLPTSCTTNSTSDPAGNHPGVGFFNTSNNTLYRCTAVNTFTPYYTAYTYPHPLDASGFPAAPIPQVAVPVITPSGGVFSSPVSVTLSDSTTGAVICYTTNGATPTTNGAGTCTGSSFTYTGAFTVSVTSTVEAVGTLSGDADSGIASATFTIGPQLPYAPAPMFALK